MCKKLNSLQIVNSFRIFIDLQSIDMHIVPPSFLCNYSVRFVLTEANNEDMEGFNDIWANILNGDIINNSENISEHPSLAVRNKNFRNKKADLSTTNQMMGDISVINKEEGIFKSPDVVVAVDISKEEGEILKEITSALDKDKIERKEGDGNMKIEDQKGIEEVKEDQKEGNKTEKESQEKVEEKDRDNENLDKSDIKVEKFGNLKIEEGENLKKIEILDDKERNKEIERKKNNKEIEENKEEVFKNSKELDLQQISEDKNKAEMQPKIISTNISGIKEIEDHIPNENFSTPKVNQPKTYFKPEGSEMPLAEENSPKEEAKSNKSM